MKRIKTYNTFNENLLDMMTSKSDEDIINHIKKYVTEHVNNGIDMDMIEELAENFNQDTHDVINEILYRIPKEQCIKIITEVLKEYNEHT